MAGKHPRKVPKAQTPKSGTASKRRGIGKSLGKGRNPYESSEYWWERPPFNFKGSTGRGRLGAVTQRVAYLYELARRCEPAPYQREDLPPWPRIRHLWLDLTSLYLAYERHRTGSTTELSTIEMEPLNGAIPRIRLKALVTAKAGCGDPLLLQVRLSASDAELRKDFIQIVNLQRERHGITKIPPNTGTKYRKPRWGYLRYLDATALEGNQSHASMRAKAKDDAVKNTSLLKTMIQEVVVPYLAEVRQKGTFRGTPSYFVGEPDLGWAGERNSDSRSSRESFEKFLQMTGSEKPRRRKKPAPLLSSFASTAQP